MRDYVEKLKAKKNFRMLSGVSENMIEQAEAKLELRFSAEYIKFLFSCGVAMADGHEFVGLGSSKRLDVVENTLEERNMNPKVPMKLYVVEQTGIDGIVIWQSSSGEVYKTEPNKVPKKICNSLLEYIDME